uniref:Ig-like domain-containing protein n=1 Tax=Aliarcobacter cryaerophilus TaxID=28198 RepID=UPI00082716F4
VKDSLGNLTELKVGDTLSLNDTIVAASSNTDLSKIEILFDTNELITLSQGEQLLDTTLLASTFGNEELAFDKQEVDETLNTWNNAQDGDATDMETAAGDVTEQATNAGDERAADGGALRSKFNSRDGSSTDVRSDLRDGDFDGGNPETPQEQIPTELLNPVGTTTPTTPTTPTIPVDTTLPEAEITIDVIAGDGVINLKESQEENTTITGTVGKDVKVGDTVTVTVNGKEVTTKVVDGNKWSVEVKTSDLLADSDKQVEAKVTTKDSAGNEATASTDKAYAVDTTPPIITLEGKEITESTVGEITGEKAKGTVTIKLDKAQSEDLVVKLKNEFTGEIQDVIIKAGETSKTVEVETSRVDDAYKQGITKETISIVSTSDSEINIVDKKATITINDDVDPIDVTITATVTTPKIIDVNTKTDGTTGVKVTGYNSDGKETNLSIIKGTNHDGFGVEGKNLSNGDTKELGVGEKIVVEFTDGKDVNSLDVSFAWRNNHETAKLTFINDGKIVGYATVDGDGSSTTKAIVKYYDKNNNLIKEVNAKGSSDKVDEAFTFELPSSKEEGSDLVSFDKVEFSAPQNKDDYLINKIVYKEVLDPTVTDIVTNGGKVTFNIQIDENYPPQGKATAIVEINNIKYDVVLNATGRGTLTLDSSKLGTDLSKVEVKVLEVKGGNYEKVNSAEKDFDFTPTVNTPTSTDDTIFTDEDIAYTLKVTDFGEVSGNTKEFKITQLPENGKLFLIVTKGETIFNKDGTQTVATEDTKVEITKDQIVTLAEVGARKVEFVANENSDDDGSFKFQVGDGNGNFSGNYTTDIIVKAVADAPDVTIDVAKIDMQGDWHTVSNSITLNASKSNGKGGNKNTEFEKSLDSEQKSIKINLKEAGNIQNINGEIRFYNKNSDGTLTEVGSPQKITQFSAEYKPGNNLDFDTFKVINLAGQKSNGQTEAGHAFHIENYSYVSNENLENNYEVYFEASLTDTDGSETLSVVIKNVPAGATLESNKYEISKNADGSYTVKVPAGAKDISDSLTMKVPESYKGEINLEIVGRSTENDYTKPENEDGKNYAESTDRDAVVTTVDETSVLTVSKEATNIVFTLDVTTSMVYNDYRDGNHTSLHVLQKSAISTIEAYASKGETNVNMTIFSKSAHNLGWMTSKEAIAYLTKLTQDENGNELRYWELNDKLENSLGITDVSTTNYKNAIAETVKVDFSGKSGNNVGYFISDGRPWDSAGHTTKEFYSIGKDYQDKDSWNKWESFIKDNKIDLKAIGIGMPEDNKKAESFLKDIQAVMGHKDIILIDEPTSMETIFLSTVDGIVSGDVSDNIFGGDGKVTIDSIVVGGTTYNKADYPYGLSTDKLGGKLTFDFETGKYAYNGNGQTLTTDMSKSFQVNVSDENGDKDSLDVNFELKAQPITDGLVKFEKGGDINLSNLENILNLKEINLDNGKENKLSLTLDDVLKLSGDDGKIKITGDEFDSVAFKNTIGQDGQEQNWSKTAGEGVDKGFDIYVNSGDPTLQVKVEQPISDGITN